MPRVARQVRKLTRVGLHVIHFHVTFAVTNQRPAVGTQQMIVAAAQAINGFVYNVSWVIKPRGETLALHVFRYGQSAQFR